MDNQPPYINRVHMQGEVTSTPSVKAINSRTRVTSFQLTMIESWENAAGEYRERKNRITVEVVGKDSARVADEASLGSWVTLEGYFRSEQFKGQELTKVRTLSIDVWKGKRREQRRSPQGGVSESHFQGRG
jgi:single-stranded DNA-binding protein